MDENNSNIDYRGDLFKRLCEFYPKLKTKVIKTAIINFNNNEDEIIKYLSNITEIEFSSHSDCNSRQSSSNHNSAVYSFVSATSDVSDKTEKTISPKYQKSHDLIKITSQNMDLNRLTKAFEKMEDHRKFLNEESDCLIILKGQRSLNCDFPSQHDLEKLQSEIDRFNAQNFSSKSQSYASGLYQPRLNDNNPLQPPPHNRDQINTGHLPIQGAFGGQLHPCGIPRNIHHYDSALFPKSSNPSPPPPSSNNTSRRNPSQYVPMHPYAQHNQNQFNLYADENLPNVFYSSTSIDQHINSSQSQKPPRQLNNNQHLNPNLVANNSINNGYNNHAKRFSSHYPQGVELQVDPSIRRSDNNNSSNTGGGHMRQRSVDSWIEMSEDLNWVCRCGTYNMRNFQCSICHMNRFN